MLSLCTCQNTKLYDSDCKMSYLSDRCLYQTWHTQIRRGRSPPATGSWSFIYVRGDVFNPAGSESCVGWRSCAREHPDHHRGLITFSWLKACEAQVTILMYSLSSCFLQCSSKVALFWYRVAAFSSCGLRSDKIMGEYVLSRRQMFSWNNSNQQDCRIMARGVKAWHQPAVNWG